MSADYCWYALQVSGRKEAQIASQLRMKGYEEYVPMYEDRKRWSDRIKRVQLPLFQGYVFCRMNPSERLLPVLTTPGVIRIVGAGRTPLPVEETEIESIRTASIAGAHMEPYFTDPVGRRVRLIEGPLSGCEGIVVQEKKGCRLVVTIALLQRSVAVELDRDWVDVIDKKDNNYRRDPAA